LNINKPDLRWWTNIFVHVASKHPYRWCVIDNWSQSQDFDLIVNQDLHILQLSQLSIEKTYLLHYT